MTNHNERLDEVLDWQMKFLIKQAVLQNIGSQDKLNISGEMLANARAEAKQALTSLTKELIEQAKPPYYSVEEPGHNARHDGIEQYETNLKELLK